MVHLTTPLNIKLPQRNNRNNWSFYFVLGEYIEINLLKIKKKEWKWTKSVASRQGLITGDVQDYEYNLSKIFSYLITQSLIK